MRETVERGKMKTLLGVVAIAAVVWGLVGAYTITAHSLVNGAIAGDRDAIHEVAVDLVEVTRAHQQERAILDLAAQTVESARQFASAQDAVEAATAEPVMSDGIGGTPRVFEADPRVCVVMAPVGSEGRSIPVPVPCS